jgi:type II secretory pathway component PulF
MIIIVGGIVGGIVGVIVISMYLPLFDVYDQIK